MAVILMRSCWTPHTHPFDFTTGFVVYSTAYIVIKNLLFSLYNQCIHYKTFKSEGKNMPVVKHYREWKWSLAKHIWKKNEQLIFVCLFVCSLEFLAKNTESRSYVYAYISYDLSHNEVNKLGPFPPGFWFVFIALVSLQFQRKWKRERKVYKVSFILSFYLFLCF